MIKTVIKENNLLIYKKRQLRKWYKELYKNNTINFINQQVATLKPGQAKYKKFNEFYDFKYTMH